MVQVRVPGPHGDVPGHVALPDGDVRGPGVIVLPEVYGLNDDIRAHADRLASEGYVALAPDLYSWGRTMRCIAATFATLPGDRDAPSTTSRRPRPASARPAAMADATCRCPVARVP